MNRLLTPHETMAQRINGGRLTAYLDDIRLARKAVTVLLEAHPHLLDNFPPREERAQALREEIRGMIRSGKKLGVQEFIHLLRLHPNPRVEQMLKMAQNGHFKIEEEPSENFEKRVKALGVQTCLGSLFLEALPGKRRHTILFEELPPFKKEMSPAQEEAAVEKVVMRVVGLVHEWGHFLHASGKDEAIEGLSPRLSLVGIDRQGRAISEIMANLEEKRLRYKTLDITHWRMAERWGENLPLYVRNLTDMDYFSAENRKKLEWLPVLYP